MPLLRRQLNPMQQTLTWGRPSMTVHRCSIEKALDISTHICDKLWSLWSHCDSICLQTRKQTFHDHELRSKPSSVWLRTSKGEERLAGSELRSLPTTRFGSIWWTTRTKHRPVQGLLRDGINKAHYCFGLSIRTSCSISAHASNLSRFCSFVHAKNVWPTSYHPWYQKKTT